MKLNQVTVPSTDIARSLSFYKKLGFSLIVDAAPNYLRFLCPDNESTFSVHRVDQMHDGEGIYLYFECDHLDDQVKQLKEQGIRFLHDPIDQTWLWREARLKDPDGNMLILFYGGENRINPPWKVN